MADSWWSGRHLAVAVAAAAAAAEVVVGAEWVWPEVAWTGAGLVSLLEQQQHGEEASAEWPERVEVCSSSASGGGKMD